MTLGGGGSLRVTTRGGVTVRVVRDAGADVCCLLTFCCLVTFCGGETTGGVTCCAVAAGMFVVAVAVVTGNAGALAVGAVTSAADGAAVSVGAVAGDWRSVIQPTSSTAAARAPALP